MLLCHFEYKISQVHFVNTSSCIWTAKKNKQKLFNHKTSLKINRKIRIPNIFGPRVGVWNMLQIANKEPQTRQPLTGHGSFKHVAIHIHVNNQMEDA